MTSNDVPEGRVRIPGLGRTVPARKAEPMPEPVKQPKPTMTSYGIPAGRYAVTLPSWNTEEFFWFKIGPAPMFRTDVKRLNDSGKWESYYGGIREVVAAIKTVGWDAADRYGVLRHVCALCGQPLTKSALKGIGPECEAQLDAPFTEG